MVERTAALSERLFIETPTREPASGWIVGEPMPYLPRLAGVPPAGNYVVRFHNPEGLRVKGLKEFTGGRQIAALAAGHEKLAEKFGDDLGLGFSNAASRQALSDELNDLADGVGSLEIGIHEDPMTSLTRDFGHDIASPWTAIKGYTHLGLDEYKDRVVQSWQQASVLMDSWKSLFNALTGFKTEDMISLTAIERRIAALTRSSPVLQLDPAIADRVRVPRGTLEVAVWNFFTNADSVYKSIPPERRLEISKKGRSVLHTGDMRRVGFDWSLEVGCNPEGHLVVRYSDKDNAGGMPREMYDGGVLQIGRTLRSGGTGRGLRIATQFLDSLSAQRTIGDVVATPIEGPMQSNGDGSPEMFEVARDGPFNGDLIGTYHVLDIPLQEVRLLSPGG